MAKKIKWSRYIPHKPTPKQRIALANGQKELLYGGALGGGKSDLLLMCCLQYMDMPGYAAGIFRRSLTDLKLPGALLSRTRTWLKPFINNKEIRYIPNEHTYYFPTRNPDGTPGEDAKMVFCYCNDTNAKDRYQSSEFQTICFDELNHWEFSDDYEFMLTRLRKNVCVIHGKKPDNTPNWVDGCLECAMKKMMPVRMRAATNPGGLGGAWIKKWWNIIPDPSLYPERRDAILAITQGKRVPFVGNAPGRTFVPAYIDDNPYLDQDDYDHFLKNLSPELRSALRDGNWEARADTRFKRQWVRYFDLFTNAYKVGLTLHPFSHFTRVFMTVDPAGTSKEGMVDQLISRNRKKGPSYTSIAVWGVDKESNLYMLDHLHFREEIPDVVQHIVDMYKRWNSIYSNLYAVMETNGVGLGAAQYVRRLGIPVKACKKSKDKLENSTAAQLLMRAGKVYFPHNADWINNVEDEIFGWSGLPSETDDIVDTLSDAANELGVLEATVDSDDNPEPITYPFTGYAHYQPKLVPDLAYTRKRSPFSAKR